MTITARTVPKFCAHIHAALPEIFFLDLISLVISGSIEPWSECQSNLRNCEICEVMLPRVWMRNCAMRNVLSSRRVVPVRCPLARQQLCSRLKQTPCHSKVNTLHCLTRVISSCRGLPSTFYKTHICTYVCLDTSLGVCDVSSMRLFFRLHSLMCICFSCVLLLFWFYLMFVMCDCYVGFIVYFECAYMCCSVECVCVMYVYVFVVCACYLLVIR